MEDIDNLKATELTLGLPGAAAADHLPERSPVQVVSAKGNKRAALFEVGEEGSAETQKIEPEETDQRGNAAPATKAQVVGWPPVRSHRINSFRARKKTEADQESINGGSIYVKVSMDGAPYLRKVDLKICNGYKDLRGALENMFRCFSLGGGEEGYDGSEYAITYEDKDGDWMLVGDVPWEMFISSCKRLRIMKGCEARGLSTTSSYEDKMNKGEQKY